MSNLSIGKIRGLQQISTTNGLFIISALDHRGSFKSLIEKESGIKATYSDIVEYKMELCQVIAPLASGILLDPNYGVSQSIARGVLPGNMGLLVSIEATGYEGTSTHRLTTLLDHWSVEKIKCMGASAVKMLIYYRPDMGSLSSRQLKTVDRVARDCIKFDIPFLVEPVSYPIEVKGSPEYFATKKSDLVIKTAAQMTSMPIDVLKSEFPADIRYMADKGKLLETCQRLDQASRVPWVILSAGVDYDTFRKQVEIACQGGASGFLGGRGIWQEALRYKDKGERVKFLKTVVVDRMKELSEITHRYAKPWYQKLGLKPNDLVNISEGWYKNFME